MLDAAPKSLIMELMKGFSFMNNPGGGEFVRGAERVQIHCYCNFCDHETLKKYMESRGKNHGD